MPALRLSRVDVRRQFAPPMAFYASLLSIVCPFSVAVGQRPATAVNPSAELPARFANVAAPGEIHRFANHVGAVNCVAVSRDGRQLASASDDKTVIVYDLKTLKPVHRLRSDESPVGGVAFTPDGKDTVTASGRGEFEDRNIRLWDRPSGQQRMRIIGRNVPTTSLVVAPDGLCMMTTYQNRLSDLRFFDAPGDTLALVTHKERCWDCAFSSDSKFVVTVGGDGEAYVWSTARPPRSISRMMTHDADVRGVSFSPNGEFIVTASSDRSLRLWKDWQQEDAWQMVREFKGHADEVNDVAFAPDGKSIASASRDKSVRIWDVATGRSVLTLNGHEGPVTNLVYFPSGIFLASASADKTVRLWSLVAPATKQPIPSDTAKANPAMKDAAGLRPRLAKKANLKMPDAAAVAETEKLIQQLFKDELANAKTPDDKEKLARKITELGGQSDYSAVERYAMLKTALDLAVDAASPAAAVQANDQITAWFDVDAIKSLAALFERLSSQVRTTAGRTELAEIAVTVIEEAIAARRYEEAATVVRASSGANSNPKLVRRLRALNVRIRNERSRWDAYQAAVKQLKAMPEDAKANLVVGKHLIVFEGDWAKGLTHLAKGSDEQLKMAAQKDVAGPDSTDEQFTLGDAWLSIADSSTGEDRQAYLAAADFWYRKALSAASGLQKLRIQKSLNKVGKIPDASRRD